MITFQVGDKVRAKDAPEERGTVSRVYLSEAERNFPGGEVPIGYLVDDGEGSDFFLFEDEIEADTERP